MTQTILRPTLALLLLLTFILMAGCAKMPKVSGNYSMTVKDYEQAVKFYEEDLRYNPDSVITLTNLGRAYYNLAQYDKAEENFTDAIEVHPGYPDATFYLGLCAIAKGDRQGGLNMLSTFRYPGEPEVTQAVQTMARMLMDNTDDPNQYIEKRLMQAWDKGMQAAQESDIN